MTILYPRIATLLNEVVDALEIIDGNIEGIVVHSVYFTIDGKIADFSLQYDEDYEALVISV